MANSSNQLGFVVTSEVDAHNAHDQHYSGNCELYGIDFIYGGTVPPKEQGHSHDLVAVMAHIRECKVVSTQRNPSAVRWFEALPSRQFGPALSSARQRFSWIADN